MPLSNAATMLIQVKPDEFVRHANPEALIDALAAARVRGDVAAALRCYEPTATVVLPSGHVASGPEAVRAMLEAFVSLPPTFNASGRTILDAGDVALHLSRWTLRGNDPDSGPIKTTGRSSNVARRQPDGGWLIAIDDPWGTELLGGAT